MDEIDTQIDEAHVSLFPHLIDEENDRLLEQCVIADHSMCFLLLFASGRGCIFVIAQL